MQLRFRCPACECPQAHDLSEVGSTLQCRQCSWSRDVPERSDVDAAPEKCLICGCSDLWRQKDFPQQLGLLMVVCGAGLSTVAWAFYRPAIAIGVLMAFALVDLVLFTWMSDMLVCYRCGAQHRRTAIAADHPKFDLELNERYRQEAIRLEKSQHQSHG